MKIELTKRNELYCADLKDLPGIPPVGLGKTKHEAIAHLFYLINNDTKNNYHRYMNYFEKLEIIEPIQPTLISPVSCKHPHIDLLHGSRVVSTNEHSHSNVYLCMDCGQFMIRGAMNGEYYSFDFTLVRDEHLEAAGKAVKYYSREEV